MKIIVLLLLIPFSYQLTVRIHCYENCDQREKGLSNPNNRIVLFATCTGSGCGNVKYQWSLVVNVGNIKKKLDENDATGFKEQQFVIKPKVLTPGESYKILLEASSPSKTEKLNLFFAINMGVCTKSRPCVKPDSSVDYVGDAKFEELVSTLSQEELNNYRDEHLELLNEIDKTKKLYLQYRKEYLIIIKKFTGFNPLFQLEKFIKNEKIKFDTGAVKTITDILDGASKYLKSTVEDLDMDQITEKAESILKIIINLVNTSEDQLDSNINKNDTQEEPPYHHDLMPEEYAVYDYFDINIHGRHKNFEIITKNVMSSVENIGDSLLISLPDEADNSTINLKDICLISAKYKTSDLLNETKIEICDEFLFISEALAKEFDEKMNTISLTYAVFSKNYFWWKTLGMNSRQVFLKLYDDKTVITNVENPINIYTKINNDKSVYVKQAHCMKPNMLVANTSDEKIVVIQLLPERHLKNILLEFKNLNPGDTIKVVILENLRPIVSDFNNGFVIQEGNKIDLSYHLDIDTGDFVYIGLMPTEETFSKSKIWYGEEFCYNMTVRISRISCDIWNDHEFELDPQFCSVHENSSTTDVICACSHASVFIVSSNNIHSSVVEDWAIPFDITSEVNLIVPMALFIILLIFLILFFCASKRQRKLKSKKRVIYLFDNNMKHECRYLICVYTGTVRFAGTTANIGIKLCGKNAESDRHLLRGYYEPVLQRGSEDWFYLLSHNLGEMTDIELWTDCHGINKSWYCRRILVYSIDEQRAWIFEVHEWLSVLNNNTSNRYSVDIEPPKQSTLKFAFIGLSRHMWSSPFKRIGNEQFTWYDRLFLVFYIVLFCMLLSIFVFGVPSPEIYGQFGRGHFEYGMDEIGLSALVSVIVFVSYIMFIFLFTTTRSWPLLYLLKVNDNYKYFARGLLYSLIIIILILLVYFGIWFSFKSSLIWIPLFIVAIGFCASLEIIRVVLIAIILHQLKPTYVSRLDLDSVHFQQEKVFRQFREKGMRPFFQKYYMPLSQVSKQLKRERELTRMYLRNILADVSMYCIYMVVLFFIVLLNKDTMSIKLSRNIDDIFVEDKFIRLNKFKQINSRDGLAAYLRNVFFPAIYTTGWYGKMTSSEAGLLVDFNSKLLGIPRVRQHRVQLKSCGMFHYTFAEHDIQELNLPCHSEFSASVMDTGKYSVKWNSDRLVPKGSFEARTSGIWQYQTASESKSSIIYAETKTYPGGGYIAHFGRNLQNSLLVLNYLLNTDWIDQRTRVLFFEVYVYNANSNLFSLLTLSVEMTAAGNFVKSRQLRVSKFLFLHDELAVATFVCFLMLIFMILSFSLRKYQQLKINFVQFFHEVWNITDILIILNAFGFVIIYLLRDKVVSELIKELEASAHNKFVSFNNALFWDDSVTVSATLLVAISTIRLWKLLRFVKMFRVCELTLILSAKYLVGIAFIGIMLLLAYSVFGFIIFGPYSRNFMSVGESFLTLIIYCSGFEVEIDYRIFEEILFGIGYIFYVFYLLMLIFILNIFITIIVVGYESSKHYYDESEQEKLFAYSIQDFLIDEWRITFAQDKGRSYSTNLAAGGLQEAVLEIEELFIELRKDVHRKEIRINRDRMLKIHLIAQGIMYIAYERKLFKRRPAVDEYEDFVGALAEQLIDNEYETYRNKEDDDVYIVVQEEDAYKYISKEKILDMFAIVEYLLKTTYKKEQKDTMSSELVDQTGAAISVMNSKVKEMINKIENITRYVYMNKGTNVTFEDLGLLEIDEEIEKKLIKVDNKDKGIIEEEEELEEEYEGSKFPIIAGEQLDSVDEFEEIEIDISQELIPEDTENVNIPKQELPEKVFPVSKEKDKQKIKSALHRSDTVKSVSWQTTEKKDVTKDLYRKSKYEIGKNQHEKMVTNGEKHNEHVIQSKTTSDKGILAKIVRSSQEKIVSSVHHDSAREESTRIDKISKTEKSQDENYVNQDQNQINENVIKRKPTSDKGKLAKIVRSSQKIVSSEHNDRTRPESTRIGKTSKEEQYKTENSPHENYVNQDQNQINENVIKRKPTSDKGKLAKIVRSSKKIVSSEHHDSTRQESTRIGKTNSEEQYKTEKSSHENYVNQDQIAGTTKISILNEKPNEKELGEKAEKDIISTESTSAENMSKEKEGTKKDKTNSEKDKQLKE